MPGLGLGLDGLQAGRRVLREVFLLCVGELLPQFGEFVAVFVGRGS